MSDGIPCKHTISLTYSCVTLWTPQVSQIGRKWADLVIRSNITHLTFFFDAERGNPMTKSIEMGRHFQEEISKGRSWTMECWCSALSFWHIRHFSTYCLISFFILFYQKYCLKSLYILVPYGSTKYRASSKIFLNSLFLGAQRRF